MPGQSQRDENPRQKDPQSPYQVFLHIREEIRKYKWIESEKAGHDIGFEAALLGWVDACRRHAG